MVRSRPNRVKKEAVSLIKYLKRFLCNLLRKLFAAEIIYHNNRPNLTQEGYLHERSLLFPNPPGTCADMGPA
jgi:hypothetical protein